MTPELAGAIAFASMRICFAFLPASLHRFAFNEQSVTEAREAFNVVRTRGLIATWLPTTMAMTATIAAAKGDDAIRFLPFVAAAVVCGLASYVLWRLIPLNLLRRGGVAIFVLVLLTCADLVFLGVGQDYVVGFFLVATPSQSPSPQWWFPSAG